MKNEKKLQNLSTSDIDFWYRLLIST